MYIFSSYCKTSGEAAPLRICARSPADRRSCGVSTLPATYRGPSVRGSRILIKVMRPPGWGMGSWWWWWRRRRARGSKRSSEWQLRHDLQRLFDTRRDQPLIAIHNSLPNEDINIAGAEERPHAAVYLTALEEHRLYCGSTRAKKCAEC